MKLSSMAERAAIATKRPAGGCGVKVSLCKRRGSLQVSPRKRIEPLPTRGGLWTRAAFWLVVVPLTLAFPCDGMQFGGCPVDDLDARWECIVTTARNREKAASIRWLEARLEETPEAVEAPWMKLSLARILWKVPDSRDRIEALLRGSIEGFQRQRHATGCYQAHLVLVRLYGDDGQVDRADRTLRDSESCGPGSEMTRLSIATERARLSLRSSRDLGLALRQLRTHTPSSPEIDETPEGWKYWDVRARLHHELGHAAAMLGTNRRLLRQAVANRDSYAEASRRHNIVTGLLSLERPSDEVRRLIIEEAHRAISAARRAERAVLEPYMHSVLGRLERDEKHDHLTACFAAAGVAEIREYRLDCLAAAAVLQASSDPEAADRQLREALGIARDSADPFASIHLWREATESRRRQGDLPGARRILQTFLEMLEDMRHLQDPLGGRIGWTASWSEPYKVATGLAALSGDLGASLSASERLRARALLDSLTAAGSGRAEVPTSGTMLELRSNLEKQLDLQRDHLGLPRSLAANQELASLEDEELSLWQRIAIEAPTWASLHAPDIPTISATRSLLTSQSAVLSLQVAEWENLFGDFGGGSWALVIWRDGATIKRLPGISALEPKLEMLDRLPSPDVAPQALEQLHSEILSDALASLPQAVDHLILVPDGPLHKLPWAALRSPEDGTTLAERYRLSIVPSLTLWRRWRERAPEPTDGVLALADPAPERVVDDESTRRWLEANGRLLDPLPAAVEEGNAVLDRLDDAGTLLVGQAASEPALVARLRESPYPSVVHFAAHAVADLENPSRSAVVLAAEGDADGLLRPPEIARLPLRDALVVLSTCDSASGQILRGEGAMSLARPFFQAGARAIVASLRPVRDRATADLFTRFYDRLADGASVAAALADAQAELAAEGRPAADWASFIVLGDGALTPYPATADRSVLGAPRTLALTACALALVAALLIRRRRRRVDGAEATA